MLKFGQFFGTLLALASCQSSKQLGTAVSNIVSLKNHRGHRTLDSALPYSQVSILPIELPAAASGNASIAGCSEARVDCHNMP